MSGSAIDFTELPGGSATNDSAWAKEKTAQLFGGGHGFSQSVYTSHVTYQPLGMTVEEASERLYATFEAQGIEMPEEGAPESVRSRLAEHNRRVRQAKLSDGPPDVSAGDSPTSVFQPSSGHPPTPSVAPSLSSDDNEPMTAVSREELDAKLDVLRSDVRAGNAELRADFHAMRADLANTRTAMAQELASVATTVGELKGSIDGVKTGLTTVQWLVGTLLGAAALYVAVAQFLAPPPAPAQSHPATTAPAVATPAQPAK